MKTIYTIEITGSTTKNQWYSGMDGQQFEAEKHADKFWVNGNPLFKVYLSDCKILTEIEEKEYYRMKEGKY